MTGPAEAVTVAARLTGATATHACPLGGAGYGGQAVAAARQALAGG